MSRTTRSRTGLCLNVFALKRGWDTAFTFCVADSIASHAVSAVQALPVCTLAHLIILREKGKMCKESGWGQQNLDGPVIRVLAPKRLISFSAMDFLHPWGGLLAY